MRRNIFSGKIKELLVALLVLGGLSLIVGATRGLPVSAQGLVTGRSDIAIDLLVDRVGADELTLAVTEAGIVDAVQGQNRNNAQRQRRNGTRNQRSIERRPRNLDGGLDDQLERIGPEIVYQIAVDAGLLTQTEASRMLEQ